MSTKKQIEEMGFRVDGFKGSAPEYVTKTIEVPNPEKRRAGRYPQKGWTPTIQKTVTELVPGTGASAKNISMTGRPSAWLALWEGLKSGGLSLPLNQDSRDLLLSESVERVKFNGGSCSDLDAYFQGSGNMAEFYAAKDLIEGSEWLAEIRRNLEAAYPKRRRVYGDEGQWVEGRRWDGDAFEDLPVVKAPCQQVEIVSIANAPWYVKAEDLTKYGAAVWAVVDALESFGVSVKLTQRYYCADGFQGNETGVYSVELKEAGEYLSPSFIAGFMTPNFFRRVVWTAFTAMAEAAGKKVSRGYGRNEQRDPVSYRDGVLTLSHEFGANPALLLPALIEFLNDSGAQAA